MVTIDKMTMNVTVHGGAEAGRASFERLFEQSMERWWSEHTAQEARSRQTAMDRRIGGRGS